MPTDKQLQNAYAATTLFVVVAVIMALIAGYFLYRYEAVVDQLRAVTDTQSSTEGQSFIVSLRGRENIVQAAYPHLDFSRFYPGVDAGDIDLIQRESFGIRYVYSAFNQFEPLEQQGRFVNISPHGFRQGTVEVPWPPQDGRLKVFVFGGSTTFGYGVPDDRTLVSQIAARLSAEFPESPIDVYNFGRGYYFSTQERVFFETLLQQGVVPDIAIFVDGLNDFFYPDGRPQLTENLFKFTAPDIAYEGIEFLVRPPDREAAVENILARYETHTRLVRGMAAEFGVDVLFIGQPVPFLHYPGSLTVNYPFAVKGVDRHYLAQWGYDRFEAAAAAGRFGTNFTWAGDAFADQSGPMYVDLVHYGYEGNALLADTIVSRALKERVHRRLFGDRLAD